MKTKPTHLSGACAVLAGILAVLPAARADLLVYEPFNYPVGSLTALNGGIGFASGWQNSNGVNDSGYVWDETTSVTFDNATLNWDGVVTNGFPTLPATGARYMGASASGSSNLNIFRELSASAGELAGPGGVLWMSAVYSLPNRTFGAGIHIGLGSGWMRERSRQFQSTDTDFIGASPYTGASNVWNTGNLVPVVVDSNTAANAWQNFSRTVGPALPAATLDMIVILKFTFGASDTVEAAVFPEDADLATITEANFDVAKAGATYAAGIDESNLNYLVINQGRFNNALDEVRIGTTFESVITLPAPGPVDAAISTVAASPSVVPADGSSPSTITVTLTDALGIPVPAKDVTLANTGGPQAAIIDPLGAVPTDANGQATFTVSSSTAGTEVFTATNTTDALVLTQTASVVFVDSADAGLSTVVAAPLLVAADGAAASTITVTLRNAGNLPVPDKAVSLTNTGGPQAAIISPQGSQISDANGQVVFTVSSYTAGIEEFTASIEAESLVITQTASVTFVGPVDATVSTVAASPDAVVANGTLSSTITVALKDANGVPVKDKEVTLANTAGPLAAVITPETPVTTDAGGVATFTVSSATVGIEEFTATNSTDNIIITQTASVEFVDPNLPQAINVSFFNSAGTPAPADPAALVGPAGGLGESWNQFNGASAGNLLSTTGVLTGVGFTIPSDNRWNWGAPALAMLQAGAAQFGKGADTTFTITGLVPEGIYNIALASYAHNDALAERAAGAWTTPNPSTTVGPQVINCLDGLNGGTWELGRNYVFFENVRANGSGQIVFNGDAADIGDFDGSAYRLPVNGFQLVPAGAALITSFGIPGYPGVIDQVEKTISLEVPASTDFGLLAPVFTLTTGTCNQTSGEPPAPTFAAANPVEYIVTDNSTEPPTVNSYLVTVGISSSTPYQTWAGDEPFDGDKNNDGVDNGLAFLLGADNPDDNALGLLPAASEDAGGLVLVFNMLNAAMRGSAALTLEWSHDLGATDLWESNQAVVPDASGTVNGVVFSITPGDPTNTVQATIPVTEAPDGRLFGRLMGTEN
jgi:hypothetical protein